MHYYQHNIADFNNATRHLTLVERALYRDLIDYYYDTERPLNGNFDALARRMLARTDEERAALKSVLDEFFTVGPSGEWMHARCDAELLAYRQKQEQASEAGKASAAARAAKAAAGGEGKPKPQRRKEKGVAGGEGMSLNARSTPVQPTNNQEPITNKEIPPIPPAAGGADAGQGQSSTHTPAAEQPVDQHGIDALVAAQQLAALFPEHCRQRQVEVAELIAELQASGVVTVERLLQSAKAQRDVLHRDDGRACPSALRWVRDGRWRDVVKPVAVVPMQPKPEQSAPVSPEVQAAQAEAAKLARQRAQELLDRAGRKRRAETEGVQ